MFLYLFNGTIGRIILLIIYDFLVFCGTGYTYYFCPRLHLNPNCQTFSSLCWYQVRIESHVILICYFNSWQVAFN